MKAERLYAWVHFAEAGFGRGESVERAASRADQMLVEFDKRFGPCKACHGDGHVHGPNGSVKCDVCAGKGCAS
jgi:RecJ-like exonuclease